MPLDVTSDAWKKTWQVAAVHTLACILPRCWAPRAPILAPPRGTCEGTPPLAPRERRGQRMMEVRRVAKRAAEAPSALRCACAARVLGRLLRAGPRACAGGACRGTEGWGGEEASQRETCGGAAEQVSCAARQPGGCSSSAVVFAGPNQRASGTSRPSSGAQHDFLRHTRPWEQAERTRAGVVWPVGGEIRCPATSARVPVPAAALHAACAGGPPRAPDSRGFLPAASWRRYHAEDRGDRARREPTGPISRPRPALLPSGTRACAGAMLEASSALVLAV